MNRIGDVAVWPAIAPNANALPYEIRLRGWVLWLTAGFYGLLAIGCLVGAATLWLASVSSGPRNPWLCFGLGSGLIDHNQKMTVAAMQMADMKVWAHRS